MRMTTVITLAIALVCITLLAGCWWEEKSPDLGNANGSAAAAVDAGQQLVTDTQAQIDTLQAKPDLSPAEAKMLQDLKDFMVKANDSLAKAKDQLAVTQQQIDNAPTNGDAVLDVAGGALAAFVPIAPIILSLFKSKGAAVQAFETLVSNVHKTGIVQTADPAKVAQLKQLNITAGIQDKITPLITAPAENKAAA